MKSKKKEEKENSLHKEIDITHCICAVCDLKRARRERTYRRLAESLKNKKDFWVEVLSEIEDIFNND